MEILILSPNHFDFQMSLFELVPIIIIYPDNIAQESIQLFIGLPA